jgi:hypothetical protein
MMYVVSVDSECSSVVAVVWTATDGRHWRLLVASVITVGHVLQGHF